jgi:hypothetical protein
LAGAAAVAVTIHTVGLVMSSDRSLGQQAWLLALPALALGLTAAAAVALRRSFATAFTLTCGALIAALLVAGHTHGELSHSELPGRLDPLAARLLAATPIGIAAGAVLAATATAVTLVDAAASRPWNSGQSRDVG